MDDILGILDHRFNIIKQCNNINNMCYGLAISGNNLVWIDNWQNSTRRKLSNIGKHIFMCLQPLFVCHA